MHITVQSTSVFVKNRSDYVIYFKTRIDLIEQSLKNNNQYPLCLLFNDCCHRCYLFSICYNTVKTNLIILIVYVKYQN